MLYCEKCKTVSAYERCEFCKNKDLREAKNDDFCILTEIDETSAQMIEDALVDEGIKCVLIPSGNGARSAFGLSLGNNIIFVPFEHYDQAKDIKDSFYEDPTEKIREDLINNRGSWNIKKKNIKKMCKKLKLKDAELLLDEVHKLICGATAISDEGLISSCLECGHYLRVQNKTLNFWVNSITYEIFI